MVSASNNSTLTLIFCLSNLWIKFLLWCRLMDFRNVHVKNVNLIDLMAVVIPIYLVVPSNVAIHQLALVVYVLALFLPGIYLFEDILLAIMAMASLWERILLILSSFAANFLLDTACTNKGLWLLSLVRNLLFTHFILFNFSIIIVIVILIDWYLPYRLLSLLIAQCLLKIIGKFAEIGELHRWTFNIY